MTNILRLAYRVSRVRFWLYLGGTYLVGYIIGISTVGQLIDPFFIAHLIYFMIPANILLYGVNDLSDRDTDMFNPKKGDKEYKTKQQDLKKLYVLVGLSFLYGFLLMSFQSDITAVLLFASWMVLSVLYSVEPIRLKAVPILDFTSNFLYVIPALLAIYQTTRTIPPLIPVFAAFCWTAAMQLFSAVPDIEADRKADVRSTAVAIGKEASLFLCLIFWTLFAVILVFVHPWNYPWNLLTFVYPLIPVYLILRRKADVSRVYWFFPYWNGIFGMVIFFTIGLPKLGIF